MAAILGGSVETSVVPNPLNCTDGFGEACYGRPEALLDPGARNARHGFLRTLPSFNGSLRLIVGLP